MPRRAKPAIETSGALWKNFRLSAAGVAELNRLGLPPALIGDIASAAEFYFNMSSWERNSPKPKEIEAARRLGIEASATAIFLPTGRPVDMAPRQLASDVAEALVAQKIALDARPKGIFVNVLGLIFQEVEKHKTPSTRARHLARDYLKWLNRV